ncbi:MAG: hypothetical protein JOY66_17960 [Acetobacteraceae bacterium]|nr:hypothetical protein [Acetobacteraceae bacterium]
MSTTRSSSSGCSWPPSPSWPHPHGVRRQGYDAERHRGLCRRFGAEPRIHKRAQHSGSGLGWARSPVERSSAWVLENKRLTPRYDRLGFIVQSLLQSVCTFLGAGRLAQKF